MSISMTGRLLIVNDEIPIIKLLKKVLQKEGHACEIAMSVGEAKARLKKKSFDLIITDLKMPDESGLDLLRFSAKNYPGDMEKEIDEFKKIFSLQIDWLLKRCSKNKPAHT